MIDFYTWATPNGRKIAIMLEAMAVDYRVHLIDITQDEQFSSDFLSISPNNKIPAIVDHRGPDQQVVSLFESGAILLYLAEKYQCYLPKDPVQKSQVIQWLMWQMGGFGPMLGQAHHFFHFLEEDIPYPKQRYLKEAQRLWRVLDRQLTDKDYVVDYISIADFAIYPWCMRFAWQDITPQDFPNVALWMRRMDSHDFVKRGMAIA